MTITGINLEDLNFEQLNSAVEHFKEVFDQFPIGITINIGEYFIYANLKLLDTFGVSSIEDLRSKIYEIVDSKSLVKFKTHFFNKMNNLEVQSKYIIQLKNDARKLQVHSTRFTIAGKVAVICIVYELKDKIVYFSELHKFLEKDDYLAFSVICKLLKKRPSEKLSEMIKTYLNSLEIHNG